jgi:hypothetical protein
VLLARVDENGLQLTGAGGFVPALVKAVLERGLATELSDHLGYEKGTPPDVARPTVATAIRRKRCKVRPGRSIWGCPATGNHDSILGWFPTDRDDSPAASMRRR